MNRDVGDPITAGNQTLTLTYKDAHIKPTTNGSFLDAPAPTTVNGGFSNSNSTITHGMPDCLEIDWNFGGGAGSVTGPKHLGAEFQQTTNAQGKLNIRVTKANITGVTGDDGHGGTFNEIQKLDVPVPTSFTHK